MSAWSSKCGTFKFSGSFPSGTPRKTSNEAIRSDLKERKVSKSQLDTEMLGRLL